MTLGTRVKAELREVKLTEKMSLEVREEMQKILGRVSLFERFRTLGTLDVYPIADLLDDNAPDHQS